MEIFFLVESDDCPNGSGVSSHRVGANSADNPSQLSFPPPPMTPPARGGAVSYLSLDCPKPSCASLLRYFA